MPSALSKYVSEPVTLVSSDVSPYEPPHLASTETSPQPAITKGFMKGHTLDGLGDYKRVEGIFLGETDGVNTSLQSLSNGRPNDSTDSQGKTHSRNGSNYTKVNGHGGLEDGEKQDISVHNSSTPLTSVDSTPTSALKKGNVAQISTPRSPESGQLGKGQHYKSRGRSHSSSAPQSHSPTSKHLDSIEPSLSDSQADLPSPESSQTSKNRLSSPPILPNGNQASAGSSSTLLHPTAPRLHHRHTLEVPRVSTSRNSRDFSFPNTTSDGGSETGRFSPTTRTPRASNTLVRAPTRSVHSDTFLDDVTPDGDVARWTDTIRQKRASRRRRKEEEEEDDRVVVGTKVDMNHVNWVTAYNMLTGIRFTVSRTNAKIDRELTDADFNARHKFSFDM